MELTKQDRKHINEEVNRLTYRIVIESKEYARLYEKEYLKALIGKLESRIESIDQYEECSLRASEPKNEQTSKQL